MKTVDVLIVYSHHYAHNPADIFYKESTPFSQKSRYNTRNDCYGFFIEACRKRGLEAALVSSDAAMGNGEFYSYWSYDESWQRHKDTISARFFFDKFTPQNSEEKELFALMTHSNTIYTFSQDSLKHLFKDKLHTYHTFPAFAIPTVPIDYLREENLKNAIKELTQLLKNYPHQEDFTHGFIIKDQFGAGGERVYYLPKVSAIPNLLEKIEADLSRNDIIHFILQPFIPFDQGFAYTHATGATDIRLIYLNKTLIEHYLRIAPKDSFICNTRLGGKSIYIDKKVIPDSVIKTAEKIVASITLPHVFFSLDFIVSNTGHTYLIEGNNNVGLNWKKDDPIDEQHTKKLITAIVSEINTIINEQKKVPTPHLQR